MKRCAILVLGLLLALPLTAGRHTAVRAQVNTYTWSIIGQGVVSDGTFDFNATYALPLDQHFIRVATAPCDVFYEDTLDWTGVLHPINQLGLVGASRYTATLEPASRAAVADGGSGYAHVSRPVTLNPISKITISLDNLALANGTQMTVCFRVP